MASHRERLNLNLSEEVEKFLIKEFYYLFQISGVFWYARGKWYYLSILLYSVFLFTHLSAMSICFTTTVLLKNYQLSVAAQLFHMGCGLVLCISIFVSVPYNRDLLIELATLAHNNFYDYGPSFDTKKVNHWINELKEFKTKVFKYVSVLFILIGVEALIGGPMIDKFQGMETKETYINGVYMKAPVPYWVPFHVSNNFLFIVVVLYQLLSTVSLVSGLCSGIFIILYFLHAINTSCRVLNESVANIEKRALYLYRKKHVIKSRRIKEIYEDENFKAEYEFCIKQNIEHHLIIVRAQDLANRLQKWPMFFVVLIVSIIIACAFFTVMKGDTRISPQLFSLLLLIQELMVIFIICWRGQEMIDTSEDFFVSFYHTKWMYCSEKIKKTIIIIQERCKTPLVYKAGGLTNIDWELFGAIMNTAYSYFNVIYAMKDSDNRDQ